MFILKACSKDLIRYPMQYNCEVLNVVLHTQLINDNLDEKQV